MFYNSIQRGFYTLYFSVAFFFSYYNTNSTNHSVAIILIIKNKLLVQSKPKSPNTWLPRRDLRSLLLTLLSNKGFVDVWNDTWKKKIMWLTLQLNLDLGRRTLGQVRSSHLLRQLLPWWGSPTPHRHGWPTASGGEWYASPSSLWRHYPPTLVPNNQRRHARTNCTNRHKRKIHMWKMDLTSAVRYSRMAALYTAAVAPTRPWLVVRVFKCLWIRPTGNWQGTKVQEAE